MVSGMIDGEKCAKCARKIEAVTFLVQYDFDNIHVLCINYREPIICTEKFRYYKKENYYCDYRIIQI